MARGTNRCEKCGSKCGPTDIICGSCGSPIVPAQAPGSTANGNAVLPLPSSAGSVTPPPAGSGFPGFSKQPGPPPTPMAPGAGSDAPRLPLPAAGAANGSTPGYGSSSYGSASTGPSSYRSGSNEGSSTPPGKAPRKKSSTTTKSRRGFIGLIWIAVAGLRACMSTRRRTVTYPTTYPLATFPTFGLSTEVPATEVPVIGGEGPAGAITLGSNYSDDQLKQGFDAAIKATGRNVAINTVDHYAFQDNIETYVQNSDDVFTWFAGHKMRKFAADGLLTDLGDTWSRLTGLNAGFKSASTYNGTQYFVPFYSYVWGVHYRKSLFAEKDYTIPTTWKEFMALCGKMKTDGVTPLAGVNSNNWPQMGMFDIINLRLNGYDFHISLLSGEQAWTDARVVKVFDHWAQLLPFMQAQPNDRGFQAGTKALAAKEVGMYYMGTFITSDASLTADDQNDLDFFAFPEIDPQYGQDAIEAPIDGFVMTATPKNPLAAKELLVDLAGTAAIEAYLRFDRSSVAANALASTLDYSPIQKKSAELLASAKYISQFLDRDADARFAADLLGPAFAKFLDGASVNDLLADIETRRAQYQ